MNIVVLGASGQLGHALYDTHQHEQITLIPFDSSTLNLTDLQQIHNQLSTRSFDHLINCAAYTNVDRAENDIDTAYQINGHAVKTIAQCCEQQAATLWQISTDYVFGNYTGDTPITPDEPPSPMNIYAKSKYLGETHAMTYCTNAMVLRTCGLHYPNHANFVATMRRLAQQQSTIRVVDDQICCPTNAADLAKMIWTMMSAHAKPGIYHAVNSAPLSWYEFACQVVQQDGLDCTIEPIQSADYPTAAKRPHYSALDNQSVQALLEQPIRTCADAITP